MADHTAPHLPAPSPLAAHWTLDPAVVFLNHGAFGAAPRAVQDAQTRWRERLERQPVQFLGRDVEGLIDAARERLARFLACAAADLVFVSNATTGVNTVLRALHFERGDELITTDHGYNACRNALDAVAQRTGARVRVVPLRFPVAHADDVEAAILAAVTPRTRLALVDHVTSPTALVLPIAKIVRELDARGIDTLVDGAHAPGMLPLCLDELGAAYYTGNGHKWLCAPKGAAFLHVRRDRQAGLRPLVISHGANVPPHGRSRFHLEFDWTGSHDPTAYLALADALDIVAGLVTGGWDEIRRRNRALALAARDMLVQRGIGLPVCPDDMVGSLAAVALPDAPPDGRTSFLETDPLQSQLLEQFRIEVPVMAWPRPPHRVLRLSAQIYNAPAQYEYLADALAELLVR